MNTLFQSTDYQRHAKSDEQKGLLERLWNSDRHALIILASLAWIVCPFDLDFVPFVGWIDDGLALMLAMKHGFDLAKKIITRNSTAQATRSRVVDAEPIRA